MCCRDLVGVHAVEIIIGSVEGADMFEAKPVPAEFAVAGVGPWRAKLAGQVAAIPLATVLHTVDTSVKMLCSLTGHAGLIDGPAINGSRRWDQSPQKFTAV